MGSKQSMYEGGASAQKQIVIVGSSFGGRILTNMLKMQDLKNHKILLIDKNEVFDWCCGDYVVLAEPGAFKQNSAKSSQIAGQHGDPNITFKQAKLVSIDHAGN